MLFEELSIKDVISVCVVHLLWVSLQEDEKQKKSKKQKLQWRYSVHLQHR